MKRLMEKTVFCGLVTACRFATVPTRRSPDLANATTDGVVRPPSAFSMTVGSPPSSTAMHEFVVPRSIPIVFPICVLLLLVHKNLSESVADFDAPAGSFRVHRGAKPSARRLSGERMSDRARMRCTTQQAVAAKGVVAGFAGSL